MRKFEDLTLAEQQRIRDFINLKVDSINEECYFRKSEAILTSNSMEVNPIISSDDEPFESNLQRFYCTTCMENVEHIDLIEHCMVHLKIE
jgi:hypothetical protein